MQLQSITRTTYTGEMAPMAVAIGTDLAATNSHTLTAVDTGELGRVTIIVCLHNDAMEQCAEKRKSLYLLTPSFSHLTAPTKRVLNSKLCVPSIGDVPRSSRQKRRSSAVTFETWPPNKIRCELCHDYITYSKYIEHMAAAHSVVQNVRFNCPLCSKSFKALNNLRQHRNTHRWSQCKICGDKLKFLSLKTHMKLHQGNRSSRKHIVGRYTCKLCAAKFASKNSLYLHRYCHRPKRVCCGKELTYWSYNNHFRRVHSAGHDRRRKEFATASRDIQHLATSIDSAHVNGSAVPVWTVDYSDDEAQCPLEFDDTSRTIEQCVMDIADAIQPLFHGPWPSNGVTQYGRVGACGDADAAPSGQAQSQFLRVLGLSDLQQSVVPSEAHVPQRSFRQILRQFRREKKLCDCKYCEDGQSKRQKFLKI